MKGARFPGLMNMNTQEVLILSKSMKEGEKSPDAILETISCIDDLLQIQSCAMLINIQSIAF